MTHKYIGPRRTSKMASRPERAKRVKRTALGASMDQGTSWTFQSTVLKAAGEQALQDRRTVLEALSKPADSSKQQGFQLNGTPAKVASATEK